MPDPKNMSGEEKEAVMAMMKNEMDYKFGLLYRMSTNCWNKCIDRSVLWCYLKRTFNVVE